MIYSVRGKGQYRADLHVAARAPVPIQAVHPAYIGTINVDRYAPDFTSCDMSQDPVYKSHARRITFWETPEFWPTGYTYPSFWRPANTPVRVGNREEKGLHMVQLWMKSSRARRRSSSSTRRTVTGARGPCPSPTCAGPPMDPPSSSVPSKCSSVPSSIWKSIAFDPETLTFTLEFARGSAKLRIDTIDQERISSRRRSRRTCRRTCLSPACARCTRRSSIPTWRASPGARRASKPGASRRS